MTVRGGHLRSGGDVELEDGDGASRVLALDQESNLQLPNPYLFACTGCHELQSPLRFSSHLSPERKLGCRILACVIWTGGPTSDSTTTLLYART